MIVEGFTLVTVVTVVIVAGLTVKLLLMPLRVPSLAVMVWVSAAVFTLTSPVQTPLVKVPLVAGLMVPVVTDRLTGPAKLVTVLLKASFAVTVMLKAPSTV